MTNSPLTLAMRIHPIRNIIRLQGRSDMGHPRHGGGADFHIDIPHYLITEDFARFADEVDTDKAAHLEMSNISGRVVWDGAAISEVTWLEFTRWPSDDTIRMEMHTCDPWPSQGTAPDEHEVGELDACVPRYIVDALDYWQIKPGPMHEIAARIMAGLTPQEPRVPEPAMKVMAGLRYGWRDQPDADQFTLIT